MKVWKACPSAITPQGPIVRRRTAGVKPSLSRSARFPRSSRPPLIAADE